MVSLTNSASFSMAATILNRPAPGYKHHPPDCSIEPA